jgi:predicted RNA binding protein YcfA (HicA-like mRNA interferase family)
MARLPSLSCRDVVRAFGRAGYEFRRQTGSHIILFSSARR